MAQSKRNGTDTPNTICTSNESIMGSSSRPSTISSSTYGKSMSKEEINLLEYQVTRRNISISFGAKISGIFALGLYYH